MAAARRRPAGDRLGQCLGMSREGPATDGRLHASPRSREWARAPRIVAWVKVRCPPVIPWLIFALVVVPLAVVGFVVARRRTVAGEHPASEDAQERARTEEEFTEAEAYEAKWREEDKERYRQERLP